MPDPSVFVTLPQLVDLAVSLHEPGLVNFNILHTVLQVLVDKVNPVDCSIEFKGDNFDRLQNLLTVSNDIFKISGEKESRKVLEQEGGSVRSIILAPKERKSDEKLSVKEQKSSESTPGRGGSIDKSDLPRSLDRSEFNKMARELKELKNNVKELYDLPKSSGLREALKESGEGSKGAANIYQVLKMSKRIEATEETVQELVDMMSGVEGKVGRLAQDVSSPDQAQKQPKHRIDLQNRVQALEDANIDKESKTTEYFDRLGLVERKIEESNDVLGTLSDTFSAQVHSLQDHITDLENEIAEMTETVKLHAGQEVTDSGQELHKKIRFMQDEIDRLTRTATELIAEKDDRQGSFDTLLEQIEMLKLDKANREDLMDALAEKADVCTVNAKVGVAQFDAAYDDLTHNIDDALYRLTNQETVWQQALLDIQTEIVGKMDKGELEPLRHFIETKIKALHERLKALSSLKQETEAAGAKSQFLRNLKCLSCDTDVVMRKELNPETMVPAPSLLPHAKNMGLYLAHELDQLRKEQRCTYNSRNMNHFEKAKNAKSPDETHICNRYCGGSHTTTTPQQRVTRLGHFMLQWESESERKPSQQESKKEEYKPKPPPIIVNSDILTARRSQARLSFQKTLAKDGTKK